MSSLSTSETSNGDPDIENMTDKIAALRTTEKTTTKHSELQESTHEVEVEVVNSSAPIETAKTFEQLGLNKDLLKGIYEMGFTRPSKIQQKALPLLLSDPPTNMIGQSQSGTGKTAAFTLTMLSRVDLSSQTTQVLCLSPARELARQITSVVREMGKYTNITITEAIPDGYDRSQRKINSHIIIGTPGTVMEMIKKRVLDPKTIKIFVLDEADNMLDQQSFSDHCLRIKQLVSKNCQIVLFSATYSDQVRSFAERFAPRANQFRLKVSELSVDSIRQYYMHCKNQEQKFDVLDDLYQLLTIGQSIIFVQKRETADIISRRMTENRHTVVSLHGGLSPGERDQIMAGFRRGDAKVLIATNVLSRGIDILQISLVINYDLPIDNSGRRPDYETYLHRIGRTGRFGRSGVSINFVHDQNSMNLVNAIEKHFGRTIKRVPTDSYEEIEKVLREVIE